MNLADLKICLGVSSESDWHLLLVGNVISRGTVGPRKHREDYLACSKADAEMVAKR